MHYCSMYVIDAPALCPLAGDFLEEKAGYSQLILMAFDWAEKGLPGV